MIEVCCENAIFSWKKFFSYIEPLESLKRLEYQSFLEERKLDTLHNIRVLLLPPEYSRNEMEPSIGLIRLASLLDFLGAKCEIYLLTNNNLQGLIGLITKVHFDFIGVSTTHYTFDRDIELVLKLKQISSGSSIIIGGHGTELPVTKKKEVFDYVDIDCFINGLGEKPLVDYIVSKVYGSVIINLPGIDTRQSISGSKAMYTEIEYNLLNALNNPKFYPQNIDTFYINTSSHCPLMCIFCSSRNFPGQKVLRISFNTLENILNHYFRQLPKIKNVFFYDDDLAVTFYSETLKKKILGKDWVKILCGKIKQNGWNYNFYSLFRTDTIDYETIDNLALSGFKRISFGLEHTDETILKKMRKPLNYSKTIEKMEYVLKSGMEVELFFIIFSKWETWDTIVKLIYDICSYVEKGVSFLYNWGFQPLHGSDLRLLENKYLDEENNKFVKNSKVIPDDPFIGDWFLHMNIHKKDFFKFQDTLEDKIYKKYSFNKLENNKFFEHIFGNKKNLNHSTTLRNLIRILSMFLWGKENFPKNVDWEGIINRLHLAIIRYAYSNVIIHMRRKDLTTDNHDLQQALETIEATPPVKEKLEV